MATKGSTPKTMKALVAYSKDDYRFEDRGLRNLCR